MNISLRYTLGAIASVFLLTPTNLLAQEVEEIVQGIEGPQEFSTQRAKSMKWRQGRGL